MLVIVPHMTNKMTEYDLVSYWHYYRLKLSKVDIYMYINPQNMRNDWHL